MEPVQDGTVERIVDVPVSQIQEDIVDVLMSRIQEQIAEVIGVPVHLSLKDIF